MQSSGSSFAPGKDNPNPFPGVAALERRTGKRVQLRLGGNESLDAPLTRLRETFGDAFCQRARLYGDPGAWELRQALAQYYGFDPEHLSLDAGADAVIGLCVQALCRPGDTVVCSAGTYPTFGYFARANACHLVEVPYRYGIEGPRVDLVLLAERARSAQARLVYLANPDNPTGSWSAHDEVQRFIEQLPEGCLLLLDEAYLDFCPALGEGSARPLPRCVRIRSMSKSHGLAGLRIGYALAERPLLDILERSKVHYALGGLVQYAALLALDDANNGPAIIERNAELRLRFSEHLRTLGQRPLQSGTNFVSFELPTNESAERVQARLLEAGIAVHRPQHRAFQHLIRVTLCQASITSGFLERLREVLP
ncbi:aminotransferase class I/II-fold pyridoxal phosphate-dependent enzyme [Pseudomonas sp. Q1-7]|uniref:aminotransferase class I/II-fold pyridoxal phosphate-dependent enzyme n=1 Tax=Pseudomonas sp. Q1-7 TaxID=3020843 RepID=UPI00230016BD|nr:aminotransferase class I/II-fold pyridoxal phosphate-dependent enzyme [Pseudomonas sp. Q1-7]